MGTVYMMVNNRCNVAICGQCVNFIKTKQAGIAAEKL